jgi:hypothetical protein
LTLEGVEVWDLFQRLVGQIRVSRGFVIGVEMGTAFQVADALGVNKFALAEFFPGMEAVLVRSMNEQIRQGGESDNVLLGGAENG